MLDLRAKVAEVVRDWMHSYANTWHNTDQEDHLIDDIMDAITTYNLEVGI